MTDKEFKRLENFMEKWTAIYNYHFYIVLYEAQAKHLPYPMVYPPIPKWNARNTLASKQYKRFIMGNFILGYHYRHVRKVCAWVSFNDKTVKDF